MFQKWLFLLLVLLLASSAAQAWQQPEKAQTSAGQTSEEAINTLIQRLAAQTFGFPALAASQFGSGLPWPTFGARLSGDSRTTVMKVLQEVRKKSDRRPRVSTRSRLLFLRIQALRFGSGNARRRADRG